MDIEKIKNKEQIITRIKRICGIINNSKRKEIERILNDMEIIENFECPFCAKKTEALMVGQEPKPKINELELNDISELVTAEIIQTIQIIRDGTVPMTQQNVQDFKALLYFADNVKQEIDRLQIPEFNIEIVTKQQLLFILQKTFGALINIEKTYKRFLEVKQ